jgi:hypothetical protein
VWLDAGDLNEARDATHGEWPSATLPALSGQFERVSSTGQDAGYSGRELSNSRSDSFRDGGAFGAQFDGSARFAIGSHE